MADVGYTFDPTGQQKKLLTGINRGKLGPMANEALRVISLKLPSVLGGSPIAPDDLLRPRVGGTPPPAGRPSPAPLLAGANASGPLNVANFRNDPSPFGAAPSDMGGLGRLANTAINPPPTFTPGEGDNLRQPAAAPNNPVPPFGSGPVSSRPGPTDAPDAADVFDMFMRRLLGGGGRSTGGSGLTQLTR